MPKWPSHDVYLSPTRSPNPAGRRNSEVSPQELFMDLVFVFTISQVTGLIAHPHGLLDYAQAGMVFLSLG